MTDMATIIATADEAAGKPRPSYPDPGWDRGGTKTEDFDALAGVKYIIDLDTATDDVVATLPTDAVVGQKIGFWIMLGHATQKLVINAGSAIIAAPGAALAATHEFPYGTNDHEYIELEFTGTYWMVKTQTWLDTEVVN